jgi:hypothetical protein
MDQHDERERVGCTFQSGSVGRVVKEHQTAYHDPITINAGEELGVGETDAEWPGWVWCTNDTGTGGWVPENYIQRRGSKGIALCAYTAKELSIHVGERLILHKAESGWFWAANSLGQSGWVPATHVEITKTRH